MTHPMMNITVWTSAAIPMLNKKHNIDLIPNS